jgi:hypothetical protein
MWGMKPCDTDELREHFRNLHYLSTLIIVMMPQNDTSGAKSEKQGKESTAIVQVARSKETWQTSQTGL